MPVEIRELVIRATIAENTASVSDAAGKEEIIAECIEQVIQILKEKEER